MSTFREQSALADARKYASAASFDIQQLPNDLEQQQALRNLLSAIESLITAVDELAEPDDEE